MKTNKRTPKQLSLYDVSPELSQAMQRGLASSSALNASDCVLLRACGTQLSISSIDSRLGQLTEYVDADVSRAGEALVKARQLQAAVSSDEGVQEISLTAKGLRIHAGDKRSYLLPTLPVEQFPLEPGELIDCQSVPVEAFTRAFKHVHRSVGKNNTPAFLNNLLFDSGFAVASDQVTLSHTTIAYRGAPFSFPGTNAKAIAGLAERSEEIFLCKRERDTAPSRLRILGRSFEAIVNLDTRHPYADWRRMTTVSKEKPRALININPKTLLDSTNRVSHFTQKMGEETVIALSAKNKKSVLVTTLQSTHGVPDSAEETLDAELPIKPKGEFRFHLSHRLLSRTLQSFKEKKISITHHNRQLCSLHENSQTTHYLSTVVV